MAVTQVINSRFIQKHDVEANWLLATEFIPAKGEIIIYDPDTVYTYARFKIGDGVTSVNNLSFTLDLLLAEAKDYVDEAILGGKW